MVIRGCVLSSLILVGCPFYGLPGQQADKLGNLAAVQVRMQVYSVVLAVANKIGT